MVEIVVGCGCISVITFQVLLTQTCLLFAQPLLCIITVCKSIFLRPIRYAAQTNSRLLHVLSDLVKTFLDTENDIQSQLEQLGFGSGENREEGLSLQGFPSFGEDTIERLSQGESTELCEDGPDLTPSSNLIYVTPPSSFNVSQNVEDDVVLGASRRLRSAVDRILKLLNEIVVAHQEHDYNLLLKRNEELLNELNEECVRRNKLTSQLLQNEERVKILEKEKTELTEKMIDYNDCKKQYVIIKSRLGEYEAERDKWIVDNQRLENEKCTFAQGLPKLQQSMTFSSFFSLSYILCT